MTTDPGWTVSELTFDPARLHHKETLFTLGNGYLSTRGAFEEGYPGAWPASLIHGVFDDVPIVHTELANCPDWLSLWIWIDDEPFRLDRGRLLAYERWLDLRRGLLCRRVGWASAGGHTLELYFERFASLADPHVLAIRCQITPVELDGRLRVQAGVNGYADNSGVKHWDWVDQDPGSEAAAGKRGWKGSPAASWDGAGERSWLQVRTRHSGIELAMATGLWVQGARVSSPHAGGSPGYPLVEAVFDARRGATVEVYKYVTMFTSREEPDPAHPARDRLANLRGYDELRAAHEQAWATTWRDSDVRIDGDAVAQVAVRHGLFQILIAAPHWEDRASIPAKTLSGFGYRGHVFWDTELFILPFLTFTQPQLARNLLTYRYHTLAGARRKAQEAGYEGAMFAWESAATGDEVTPRWVPTPWGGELVRIWCGDIELHVSADVAYAAWSYWRVTGDDEWMMRYGAEILLDTAVFWGSRAEPDPEQRRYEIRDVIGPDEYHDHVHDNAFTNRMVRWHLETAPKVLAWLEQVDPDRAAELVARLDLSAERLAHWAEVVAGIRVLHDEQSGLFEQFEGFFDLQDLDLAEYEPRTQSMQALLGIEGANRVQVLKQPDVLMLLYLLSDDYDRQTLRTNWDYYAPRTDHTYGSSLGPAIHAILACRLGMAEVAYEHFARAALMDLEDLRGNTADGIHGAAAGGVWQAAVFGFGGVRVTDSGLVAEPCLPPGWERLRFRLQHRGRWYDFDLKPAG